MPLGAARINFLAKSITVAPVVAEVIRKKVGIQAIATAQVDTAQYKFGGSSALFNPSSLDHLLIEDINGSNDLDTNWTFECWYRPTNRTGTVYPVILANHTTSWASGDWGFFDRHNAASTKFTFFINAYSSVSPALESTTTVSNGTWYHLAVVKQGDDYELFVNGTSEDTLTTAAAIATNRDLRIGSSGNATTKTVNGHIDEIRISDTARYTSGFTPSTTPFVNDDNTKLLLHCDGTDGSTYFDDDNGVGRAAVGVVAIGNAQTDTAQYKFGGTSLLCDGTGDYLYAEQGCNLGTGDFTIEFWVRWNNITGLQAVITDRPPTSAGLTVSNFYFEKLASHAVAFGFSTAGYIQSASSAVTTGVWYHFAAVRSSGTIRAYKDGVEFGTALSGAYATIDYGDGTLSIGASTGYYLNGWVDEVRLSTSARYTSGFTPSTTPFVNDANTKLLLHMDGTDARTLFLDDNGATRSRVGVQSINGAAIDTANYQFGGSSAEFDDVNDYLELPYEVGNFSGDFTVECWMDTADTEGEFIACQKQSTAEGWGFVTRSLGRLIWTSTTDGSTASALISSNNAFSNNTWTHIAVCHTASTGLTEMFANGTRVGSRTEQNPKTVTSGGYFRIGGNIYGVSSGTYSDGPRYFGGHLDEVRISNSVRYSGASYTVPTEQFQNDANTVLLLHCDGSDGSTDFVDDNGKEST